ncbi:MAG: two-component system, sensor histidine kinase and response regulator [Bacteroidales bacterium]|nr:two-component system, sensor histidine kinase and response regulator [Bacteroidales bacterium]
MDMQKFKILIVDDNPKNLQVLGNLLEKNHYHVEYALSGSEALEWIKSEQFDLLLLDIMMPGMDGYEVCEIIRKDEQYQDIPIIFLTAKTDKESIVKGFELNAQDYVSKPFDTAELLARINTHLELKDSRDKLKNVNQWLEQKVDEKTRALQESNKKLEEALTELQNLDKMKSYFLNMTSTEIRTPLTGIIGTLHVLKNQEASFALKNLIDLLEKSVSRLENFANKAILTTELSAKTYPFKEEEIDVAEIVNFSLLELNEELRQRNIDIEEHLEDIKISGDKDLIFKALLFLIRNASEHTGDESKIEISLKNEDRGIVLSILDFGKGFSKETIEEIYSPYRFKEEAFNENNELSMYIVKLIMDYHHGALKVFNKKNAGACVELIFAK